ncbi:hypothetical protein SAMN04488600_101558 [Paenibacillus polymyxa]|nr:hypothetical protein SAMN04488600_101558 [Paenibacillus polymyxa]
MAKKKRKRKSPEVKDVIQFLTVLITLMTAIINLIVLLLK